MPYPTRSGVLPVTHYYPQPSLLVHWCPARYLAADQDADPGSKDQSPSLTRLSHRSLCSGSGWDPFPSNAWNEVLHVLDRLCKVCLFLELSLIILIIFFKLPYHDLLLQNSFIQRLCCSTCVCEQFAKHSAESILKFSKKFFRSIHNASIASTPDQFAHLTMAVSNVSDHQV